jgi:hypothetical protein
MERAAEYGYGKVSLTIACACFIEWVAAVAVAALLTEIPCSIVVAARADTWQHTPANNGLFSNTLVDTIFIQLFRIGKSVE